MCYESISADTSSQGSVSSYLEDSKQLLAGPRLISRKITALHLCLPLIFDGQSRFDTKGLGSDRSSWQEGLVVILTLESCRNAARPWHTLNIELVKFSLFSSGTGFGCSFDGCAS